MMAHVPTPHCTVQLDKKKPVCGQPMFRVGIASNNAWVCPECDRVPLASAMDAPE